MWESPIRKQGDKCASLASLAPEPPGLAPGGDGTALIHPVRNIISRGCGTVDPGCAPWTPGGQPEEETPDDPHGIPRGVILSRPL